MNPKNINKKNIDSVRKTREENTNRFDVLQQEYLEFEEPIPEIIKNKQGENTTEMNFGNLFNVKRKNINQIKKQNKKDNKNKSMSCLDCEVEFSRSIDGKKNKEINIVESGTNTKTKKGKVTVDSGAEESVWPSTHVNWEKVKETEDSRKGIGFIAANGVKMPNYGSTQVDFKKDGKVKRMNFAVTDCKKPLASVSRIVDKGNRVVFDDDESYILNKKTGERIMLERERGTYVMVVEFDTGEEQDAESGFRRLA